MSNEVNSSSASTHGVTSSIWQSCIGLWANGKSQLHQSVTIRGTHIACTAAGALGCWGHRDQLLGDDGTYNFGVGLHCTTCDMGTGSAIVNGSSSFTSLIELP